MADRLDSISANKEISTLCDRLFCLRCEREVLLCHCAVVRPIATRRWRELSRIVFVENSENRPWSNALSDQFHQNKFHLRSLLQNSSNAANFPCVRGAERPVLRPAQA